MVFVTTGTQAPFDRFVKIIDEVAEHINEEIVAQAFKDKYEPKNVKVVDFLPPDEFNRLFSEARLIVSHAGMGTIVSAMQKGKPIVVFPRIAALGEHRNEHQLATAMKLNELGYVHVAYDKRQLSELLLYENLQPLKQIGEEASPNLINSISEFIDNDF